MGIKEKKPITINGSKSSLPPDLKALILKYVKEHPDVNFTSKEVEEIEQTTYIHGGGIRTNYVPKKILRELGITAHELNSILVSEIELVSLDDFRTHLERALEPGSDSRQEMVPVAVPEPQTTVFLNERPTTRPGYFTRSCVVGKTESMPLSPDLQAKLVKIGEAMSAASRGVALGKEDVLNARIEVYVSRMNIKQLYFPVDILEKIGIALKGETIYIRHRALFVSKGVFVTGVNKIYEELFTGPKKEPANASTWKREYFNLDPETQDKLRKIAELMFETEKRLVLTQSEIADAQFEVYSNAGGQKTYFYPAEILERLGIQYRQEACVHIRSNKHAVSGKFFKNSLELLLRKLEKNKPQEELPAQEKVQDRATKPGEDVYDFRRKSGWGALISQHAARTEEETSTAPPVAVSHTETPIPNYVDFAKVIFRGILEKDYIYEEICDELMKFAGFEPGSLEREINETLKLIKIAKDRRSNLEIAKKTPKFMKEVKMCSEEILKDYAGGAEESLRMHLVYTRLMLKCIKSSKAVKAGIYYEESLKNKDFLRENFPEISEFLNDAYITINYAISRRLDESVQIGGHSYIHALAENGRRIRADSVATPHEYEELMKQNEFLKEKEEALRGDNESLGGHNRLLKDENRRLKKEIQRLEEIIGQERRQSGST